MVFWSISSMIRTATPFIYISCHQYTPPKILAEYYMYLLLI